MIIIDQSVIVSIGFVASCASILTATIAVFFYFFTVRKDYYLNDVKGDYKIFSGLRGKETATVLYNIKITHITSSGWFFGSMKYSEVFAPQYSGSGGILSVYGKLNYNFFRIALGFLYRIIRLKKFNPLETTDIGSFHGKMYILSRNDLNTTDRNWKDMLLKEYQMIHYRHASRFKLYDNKKKVNNFQLVDELTLINVNRIADPMYDNAEITF